MNQLLGAGQGICEALLYKCTYNDLQGASSICQVQDPTCGPADTLEPRSPFRRGLLQLRGRRQERPELMRRPAASPSLEMPAHPPGLAAQAWIEGHAGAEDFARADSLRMRSRKEEMAPGARLATRPVGQPGPFPDLEVEPVGKAMHLHRTVEGPLPLPRQRHGLWGRHERHFCEKVGLAQDFRRIEQHGDRGIGRIIARRLPVEPVQLKSTAPEKGATTSRLRGECAGAIQMRARPGMITPPGARPARATWSSTAQLRASKSREPWSSYSTTSTRSGGVTSGYHPSSSSMT